MNRCDTIVWSSRSRVSKATGTIRRMHGDLTTSGSDVAARTRALIERVEQARFAGATPRVTVPDGASGSEIVAHTLAAERLGVPLLLDGAAYQLHEDRAWEALRSAQAALGRWSFGQAEAQLDRATNMADDPTLQQRLAVWKALAALNRRLVRVHPDEKLRGDPGSQIVEMLETADQLPAAERAHYRAECARLLALHRAAGEQPDSLERALWYIVRARLALPGDDPLNGLAWCLRLSREFRHRLPLPDDEYLSDLLQKSRDYGLLAFGELDDEAAAAAKLATEKLQPWEVFRALAAHLGNAFEVDLQREAIRWTITPYLDAADDVDDD